MPRDAVEERHAPGGGTYRLELVRCGKRNCGRCPHGPYWYSYRREGTRLVSKYVGKQLPAGVAPAGRPSPAERLAAGGLGRQDLLDLAFELGLDCVTGQDKDVAIRAALDRAITRQAAGRSAAVPVAADASPEEIRAAVRAAYRILAEYPGGYVRLRELRDLLPGVPRGWLDAELVGMYQDHAVNLVSQANQEALLDADREAAVHMGEFIGDKHRISIENAAPAPGGTARPAAGDAAVDARVRAAVAELGPESRFVKLADLRRHLGQAGLGRAEVDAALDRMYRARQVNLVPAAHPATRNRPESRAAALQVGGEDKHMVAWVPSRAEREEIERAAELERAARAAAPASPARPAGEASARERLSRARTGGEAREILDGLALKKPALLALAHEYDLAVTSRDTVAEIKRKIAQRTGAAGAPPAAPGPVSGRLSGKPLTPNKWGVPAPGHPVSFHGDSAIGTAISRMGPDAHLDVDGEPLADVLGKIATGAGHGHFSAQEAVDRVKQLRDRLPAGGEARRELDTAVRRELDAPSTPPPAVPTGTPEPLRRLMAELHTVPVVRRDPGREEEPLGRIMADFAAGKTGGLRMIGAVRALRNTRHESVLGWGEINEAVRQAVKDLEAMHAADRSALRPPGK